MQLHIVLKCLPSKLKLVEVLEIRLCRMSSNVARWRRTVAHTAVPGCRPTTTLQSLLCLDNLMLKITELASGYRPRYRPGQ